MRYPHIREKVQQQLQAYVEASNRLCAENDGEREEFNAFTMALRRRQREAEAAFLQTLSRIEREAMQWRLHRAAQRKVRMHSARAV